MRTPSRVRLVSAIEVASTSLRRPGGAGAIAARWSAGSRLPWRRWSSTSAGRPVEPLGGALDLGDAGQEGEQAPLPFGERAADRRRHLVLDPLLGGAAEMDELDRIGAALALDHRRVAHQRGEAARRRASPTSRPAADRGAAPPARRAPSARPKSLSRLRSWTSSNSTAETPASSGSAWMRLQEDALGQHR